MKRKELDNQKYLYNIIQNYINPNFLYKPDYKRKYFYFYIMPKHNYILPIRINNFNIEIKRSIISNEVRIYFNETI